jgi:uroporphyrinogen decarboxylase
MDPAILYANKERIRNEVKSILKSYGCGSGHIFNLGHGILPDVEPENAKAFVDFVKEESPRFHQKESVSKGI